MDGIATEMLLKAAEDFLSAARKLGVDNHVSCSIVDGHIMVFNSPFSNPSIDYYKHKGEDWRSLY